MQDRETERAAKIMLLSEDIKRAEERSHEVRDRMRTDLDELDRLATTRTELERRIQALLDGGDDGASISGGGSS